MNSFSVNRYPLSQEEIDKLRTLFASQEFLTLREILAAHCTEEQVRYMDASLYPTESASQAADQAKTAARRYNEVVEVLDWIEGKMDEWYRITLEQRR